VGFGVSSPSCSEGNEMELPPHVIEILHHALEEDIGPSDITTSTLIPEDTEARGLFIAKKSFILAGIPFIIEVFRILDPSISFQAFLDEGAQVKKGEVIAEVFGKTHAILKGERVSLNILQRLSGIATITNKYVQKVKGLSTKIYDTRKTTPCYRYLEKYAVRMGGGNNHRFGLFDGVIIKDNHIEAVGSIRKAIGEAKKKQHLHKIEVEIENLHDLKEAISAGADIVMLDNMSLKDIKEAVKTVKGRAKIEASGNITLDNVRKIAEAGVDFVSIGALTHSAIAADISMKIVK
jgi:nicotinate-nucleotide pyrophosphorylase (carboxylating)